MTRYRCLKSGGHDPEDALPIRCKRCNTRLDEYMVQFRPIILRNSSDPERTGRLAHLMARVALDTHPELRV
jgi:hypothetical protein